LLAVPRILGYVANSEQRNVARDSAGAVVLAFLFSRSAWLQRGPGAFIIGAIIAEARELGKIETLTEPIGMFSRRIFVAIDC